MDYLESFSDLAHHLGLRFSKLRTISVQLLPFKCIFSSSDDVSPSRNLEEGTVGSCSFYENASLSNYFGGLEEVFELATSRPALVLS